jgi:hypothetical protein
MPCIGNLHMPDRADKARLPALQMALTTQQRLAELKSSAVADIQRSLERIETRKKDRARTRTIELLAQGKSPAEIFHLARLLEDAINPLIITVTGGTLDLSVVSPPGEASQVPHAALIFNGTLTGKQIIKLPNLAKWWWVQNTTTGAFTLKMQTPSGSLSTAIPQNSGWQLVQCDGDHNIFASPPHTPKMAVGARQWIGRDRQQALTEIFHLARLTTDQITSELIFEVSQAVESAIFDYRIRNLKRRKEMGARFRRIEQLRNQLLKSLDELDGEVFQTRGVERVSVVGLLAALLDIPLRYLAASPPKNRVSNRPRGSRQNPILHGLIGELSMSIVEGAGGKLTLYERGGEIRGTLPAVLEILRPYLPEVIPVSLPYTTLRNIRKRARAAPSTDLSGC